MPIDLRSDTVTKPSAAMRRAMANAEVGDDVYGEDPTVNQLERECARLLGLEAGLFVASGTQSNLAALLTHCGRGDEYIAGQEAHAYRLEGGGAAVLGGIQPQPLPFEADGTLSLASIEAAIKPPDHHFAKTNLVCVENTQGGKPIPPDYLADVRALADRHGLRLHMDGARLFNAAVALGVDASVLAGHCHSVSVCLSKGLGAPAGSVLCGGADLIAEARRWRKVLGGGMRQSGILAAAGLYALEHNVERLEHDHKRAARLAKGLRECGLDVACHTNMVFVDGVDSTHMSAHMATAGVRVRGPRWVVHLDIGDEDIECAINAARGLVHARPAA